MREIATTPIGQTRTLTIWKDGRMREVTVVIRVWPGVSEPLANVLANPADLQTEPPPDLGLLLAPISPMARKAYKLAGSQGVLVVAVDQMSEAYSRGLRAGVVIEKVQEQAVATPAQATGLIRATAARLPLVALLVRWDDGARWVVLHTGYRAATVTDAGPARTEGAAEEREALTPPPR